MIGSEEGTPNIVIVYQSILIVIFFVLGLVEGEIIVEGVTTVSCLALIIIRPT